MNIIRSFLRYREIQNTKNDIFRILGTIDFSVCKNVRPLKIQKIAMLIPTVYPNLEELHLLYVFLLIFKIMELKLQLS